MTRVREEASEAVERSRCEARLQTTGSEQGSLIPGLPSAPLPRNSSSGSRRPLMPAADSLPSLTNAQGSFPNRKARSGTGTPTPLQAQACCAHPLTRREQEDASGKAGLALRLTPRLSLCVQRLPSLRSAETATQSGGRNARQN